MQEKNDFFCRKLAFYLHISEINRIFALYYEILSTLTYNILPYRAC